ncbi:MAG TPA: tRNA-intron lyase [Thermoplasmata archaeon]|nr:tRNA-intron lyase [Thermoplasmata archaeon]
MSGVLAADGTARFEDPAESSSIYAKGYFGTPTPNGGLTLDRYEAVYLAEMARAEVGTLSGTGLAWAEVFRRAVRADRGFPVRYLVYRDLRQRGYVVRASPPPVAFTVLPRGGTLHKTPSRFWIEALSEREPFDLARLFDLADRAQSAKKQLLLALVDEESDLTYYRVRRTTPGGALPPTPLARATVGWLSEDRVTVHEPAAVDELGRSLAYGSRVGDRLELSLLEATYLVDSGQLTVRDARTGRSVPADRLVRRARRLDPRFAERRAAYRELRGRKLVVKTGFKYGAHFRAYPRNPDHAHAKYLVQAVPASHRAAWPEIAGGVRVAQGVRKEFVLAAVGPESAVRFLALERIRP